MLTLVIYTTGLQVCLPEHGDDNLHHFVIGLMPHRCTQVDHHCFLSVTGGEQIDWLLVRFTAEKTKAT